MARVLDKRDLEVVNLLSGLGLDERTAKVLTFLANVPEGESAEIERGCRLRQPEVSLATKGLRTRGWIATAERRKGGKGRPVHVYRLQLPLGTIVDALEGVKREEMDSELAKIHRLRSLLSTNGDE